MKALTVIAPWGSLLAWQEKEFETRSWGTSYRGSIAIHQGKSKLYLEELSAVLMNRRNKGEFPKADSDDLDYEDLTWLAMRKFNVRRIIDFPQGAVIGTADVVDCIRMTPSFIAKQTNKELALGAWSVGRFAWQYANVKLFDAPIPVSGKQGLWEWETADAIDAP